MTRNFDSSSEFHTLFEGFPKLYLVLTPDFKIVAASEAYCLATHTVPDEILSRSVFDVFPDSPKDLAATSVSNLRASLERILLYRRPDSIAKQKYHIPRPDSAGGGFEERYWAQLNTPVLNKDGEVLWIIHRIDDLTEEAQSQVHMMASRVQQERHKTGKHPPKLNRTRTKQNAEIAKLEKTLVARSIELQTEKLERKKTEEVLKNENAIHDTVINNIPAMVFMKDAADLRFVLINPAGEKLLGIDRREYIGKCDHDFFPKEQADFFVSPKGNRNAEKHGNYSVKEQARRLAMNYLLRWS